MIESQRSIKGVIMAENKTDDNVSRPSDHYRTDGISYIFSSHARWQDLGDPSLT